MADAPFRVRVLVEHVQGDVVKDGTGLGAVPHSCSNAILPECHVKYPVQFVLDSPMGPEAFGDRFHLVHWQGADVETFLLDRLPGALSLGLNPGQDFKLGPQE